MSTYWRAVAAAICMVAAYESAEARPLAVIQQEHTISLCANPNALPHASNKPDKPGFQIEIGRAIAAGLGVTLHVDWIVPRMRANTVDCDILLDTIALPEVQEGRYKLSHPYQLSGVALGLAPGVTDDVKSFADLKPGVRVGVMVNSVASMILGKKGVQIIPYGYEDDMVEECGDAKVYGCAASPASIAYWSFTHPDRKITLVHAYESEPELRWPLAVGMRRADDALVAAMNGVIDKLLDDGTIAKIYAKYGIDHRRP